MLSQSLALETVSLTSILKKAKSIRSDKFWYFRFISWNKHDERLAFRLSGIVPHLINGTEYAFFHGRFRPLEPGDEDENVDISIFLESLCKVNSGLIRFPDEEAPELERVDGGG